MEYVAFAEWHDEWEEGPVDEPPADLPAGTVACVWGDAVASDSSDESEAET